MLYLIIGTDKKNTESFLEKESNGLILERYDAFSWDADLIRSSIESNSLFGGGEQSFVLDSISENDEALPVLMTLLEGMASSTKKFFIIESDLAPTEVETIKNRGAKVMDMRKDDGIEKKNKWSSRGGSDKYNPFALADAVGSSNAKTAWIEYERAKMAGANAEELHARVWSKVRDMIAAENADATELGIHPFVHKKAKADLRNWQKAKIGEFAGNLIGIYHRSRMGGEALDVALEKALLSI